MADPSTTAADSKSVKEPAAQPVDNTPVKGDDSTDPVDVAEASFATCKECVADATSAVEAAEAAVDFDDDTGKFELEDDDMAEAVKAAKDARKTARQARRQVARLGMKTNLEPVKNLAVACAKQIAIIDELVEDAIGFSEGKVRVVSNVGHTQNNIARPEGSTYLMPYAKALKRSQQQDPPVDFI